MQAVHCVYLSIGYRLRLNPRCIYFLIALALSHYIDLRIVIFGLNLRLMTRAGKNSGSALCLVSPIKTVIIIHLFKWWYVLYSSSYGNAN
jgi:hypothetical protein